MSDLPSIGTPFMLSLIASTYLVVAIVAVARRKPRYSHVRHTISELGESGGEYTQQVSLGVFLPIGLTFLLVAWLLHTGKLSVAALSLALAAGYLIAALFPCDRGSPMLGSFKQGLHNLGGGIEYVGGALSLFWISESEGSAYYAASMLVAGSAFLLTFSNPYCGIIQRVAEACLFGCLLSLLL